MFDFTNDTCDVRFKLFGLDDWDYTWVFGWINDKITIEECISKMMDIINRTPDEWEYEIRNFSFLDEFFLSNNFNPLFWFAEWAGQSIWFKGSGLSGCSSPADDIFLEIFGDEIYGAFYNHLVYTFTPITNEIVYRYENGLNAMIPDWFPEWIRFPTIPQMVSWTIGFEPECYGVYNGLYEKFLRLFLIIFGWISMIFVYLIRFVTLIVYTIIWFFISIQSWFIDLIIEINLWIKINIWQPIIEFFWPVIEFFINLREFIW